MSQVFLTLSSPFHLPCGEVKVLNAQFPKYHPLRYKQSDHASGWIVPAKTQTGLARADSRPNAVGEAG